MPPREPTSRRAVTRRHVWQVAAVVLVVVAAALTGVLGGWARTTPGGPVVAAAGTEISAAPFRIRLDRAAATYTLGNRAADPGQALLVVDGVLSLATSEPVASSTLTAAFTADLASAYDAFGDPAEEPEPGITVAADGSALLGLGPGLTYEVRITYVVDESDVPELLRLVVNEHVRRPSALDESLGWYDPVPVARVDLDVAPLPAQRPEPEGF